MATFEEALKIIGLVKEDQETVLTLMRVNSFTSLKSMSVQDITEAIEEAVLPKVVGSQLKALKHTYKAWQQTDSTDKMPWSKTFSADSWDYWMERYDPDDFYLIPTADVKTTVAPTPTKNVVSSTWKVDTKDIPKLPKNKSVQSGFSAWEQAFRVKMDLAKVGDLLHEHYGFDKKDPVMVDMNADKDAYLKSCLVTATMETTAYCEVSLDKSGRDIWFDLLTAYHGADFVQDEATSAMTDLSKMRFDSRSTVTADMFVSDYKTCIQKMKDNKTPFPETLIKTDFLSKVTHDSFKNWILLMEEKDTITNDDLFRKFRKHAEQCDLRGRMESGKTLKVNNQQSKEASDEPVLASAEREEVERCIATGDRMDSELWRKIGRTDRNRVHKKRRSSSGRTNNSNNNNTNHTNNVNNNNNTNLPTQYTTNNARVIRDERGNVFELVQVQPAGENNTSSNVANESGRSSTTQVNYVGAVVNGSANSGQTRSTNAQPGSAVGTSNRQRAGTYIARVNNLRCTISSAVSAKMSVQSYAQHAKTDGSLFIDGGTNVSAMGRQFRIISLTDRSCDMDGFANDLTKHNIRIGSGVATCRYKGTKCLVGLHESPILEHNKHSLLSTGQAREHGVWVADVLKRHGGDQRIVSKFENEDCYFDYDLEVENGLLGVKLSYPTDEEMESLPTVWLTSNNPWDPRVLDDDGEAIAPWWTPEDGGELLREVNHVQLEEVDKFARDLSHQSETIKHFMTFLGLAWVGTMVCTCLNTRVRVLDPDYEKFRQRLGWLPLETVEKTFAATTQLAGEVPIRYPMRRHLKARFPQLNRRRLAEKFATDTMFSSVVALGGYTCAQVYCGTNSFYTRVYGMKTESEAPETLDDFVREDGAPSCIHNDNSKTQTGKRWVDRLRKYVIGASKTEPHHPQQNPAERRIKMLKQTSVKIMDRSGAPSYLWLLCLVFTCGLLNHMAHAGLDWRTPIEKCFGNTPDLSKYLQFMFYEPIFFLDPESPFLETKERFGRFVGIADSHGDELTYWVLDADNNLLVRSVVRSANNTEEINLRSGDTGVINDYDAEATNEDGAILSLSGDSTIVNGVEVPALLKRSPRSPGGPPGSTTSTATLSLDLLTEMGGPSMEIDPTDFLGYTFVKPDLRGVPTKTTVIDVDTEMGKVLVEYAHGQEEWVLPNIVQEALLSREDEGAGLWSFKEILSHHTLGNGKVEVQVLWDNGDVSWEPVNTLRKDDPVTIARYAMDNDLGDTKGWKWARKITKNPKKYIRMLKLMTGQQKRLKKYKFGVEIPKSVRHAKSIDKENGNTKWSDAIKKEIDELMLYETFLVLEKGEQVDQDVYTYVPMLMCFDCKFDGRRKARYVANGSQTEDPSDDIYSGVVGIDTVRLALFIAELNGLQVCAADVSCAFLQSMCKEKIWTRAGEEFESDVQGRVLVMNKSIYGLKSASASYHEHLAHVLAHLGFYPSWADFDLWMKDCGTHYEYIATWVDDLLIMSKDPQDLIRKLEKTYHLKGVGSPDYYLGGDFKRIKYKGKDMLVTDAKTYIKRVTEKLENLMEWKLRHYQSPEDSDYHPELDESDFLSDDDVSKFRMMVGSLNWLVVLGRFDLCHATATMARYSNAPREGHLNAMKRIFGYVKNYTKVNIKYDTSMPDFSEFKRQTYDWFRRYGDVTEEMPYNMPEPRGNPVKMSGFFDASHASCLLTRRSVSSFLLFLNNTPVKWVSKRQATVETSTYGSEMVAGRVTIEAVIGLRYQLRMLGVPIEGSCVLFGDNQSMITNGSIPKSSLKKRHNANAYNRVREAVAAGIVDLFHCRTEYNLSDLGTKPLGPLVFQRLVNRALGDDKFPPCGQEDGELKQSKDTVNGKVHHGSLVIDHPINDRDLVCALSDPTFRSYASNYSVNKESKNVSWWDTKRIVVGHET